MKALVDDFGQPILFGEQKDIAEFNLNFLERVEEGLGERKLAKKYNEDLGMLDSQNHDKDMIKKSSIMDDSMETPNPDGTPSPGSEEHKQETYPPLNDSNALPELSIQNLFFGKIT